MVRTSFSEKPSMSLKRGSCEMFQSMLYPLDRSSNVTGDTPMRNTRLNIALNSLKYSR